MENADRSEGQEIRKGSAKWLPSLLLLLASTVISLGFLEIAVRIVSPPPPFGPYFDLRPYKKLELRPNLPGVAEVVHHSANKWGMRGDDPPKDWDRALTVLTIGGSTTQCFYLDDAKTWPHLVEQDLRSWCSGAWVGNAGLDGHSTHGHVLLMKKVVSKVHPDMVIFLVGLNDLALSVAYGDSGSPFDNHWKAKVQSGGIRSWLERSRLFQILSIWKRVLVDGVLVVNKVGHHRYHPERLIGSEDVLPDSGRQMPSLAPFLRNIDTLAMTAKALGIRPIFLTQPGLFSEDHAWDSIAGGMSFLETSRWKISASTEARLLRLFNHELLETCGRLGVECLDLGAKIPHDSAYFYDDYHFTELGAAKVAGEVSGFLRGLSGVCPDTAH